MRIVLIISVLSFGFFFWPFNYEKQRSATKVILTCDSTPVLNKKIIDFVKTKKGKLRRMFTTAKENINPSSECQ